MWTCPACGRLFANRNQTHTCGLRELDEHFEGRPPYIREIVERFISVAERNGPVTVLPEKTRIALQARKSFAALQPRQACVDGHVVLARRRDDARFRRIETFSPRNHLHGFRLERPEEVDEQVADWLAERARSSASRRRSSSAPHGPASPRHSPGWHNRLPGGDHVAVAEELAAAGNPLDPGFLDHADGPLHAWLEERVEA